MIMGFGRWDHQIPMIMKLDGGPLGRSVAVIMGFWSLEPPLSHDHDPVGDGRGFSE
jgi:hypothetical protein